MPITDSPGATMPETTGPPDLPPQQQHPLDGTTTTAYSAAAHKAFACAVPATASAVALAALAAGLVPDTSDFVLRTGANTGCTLTVVWLFLGVLPSSFRAARQARGFAHVPAATVWVAWLCAIVAASIFAGAGAACLGKDPAPAAVGLVASLASGAILPLGFAVAGGSCSKEGALLPAGIHLAPIGLAWAGSACMALLFLPGWLNVALAPWLAAAVGARFALALPPPNFYSPAVPPDHGGQRRHSSVSRIWWRYWSALAGTAIAATAVAVGGLALGPGHLLHANDGGTLDLRDLLPTQAAWLLGLSLERPNPTWDTAGDAAGERLERAIGAEIGPGFVFVRNTEIQSLRPSLGAPSRSKAIADLISRRLQAMTGQAPNASIRAALAATSYGGSTARESTDPETILIDDGDRRLAVAIPGADRDGGELLRRLAAFAPAAEIDVPHAALAAFVAAHEAAHAASWLLNRPGAAGRGAGPAQMRRAEEIADAFAVLRLWLDAQTPRERADALTAARLISSARTLRLSVMAGATASGANAQETGLWVHYDSPTIDAAIIQVQTGQAETLRDGGIRALLGRAEEVSQRDGTLSEGCQDGLAQAAGQLGAGEDARALAAVVLAERLPLGFRRGADLPGLLDPTSPRGLGALGWPAPYLSRAQAALRDFGRMDGDPIDPGGSPAGLR